MGGLDFIEVAFNSSPDGGSGLVELLLLVVAGIIGVVTAVAWRSRARARAARSDVITEPAQLGLLSAWNLFPRPASERVHIEAQDLPPEVAREWERRLERLRGACGCEQGAVGLLVGLAASALFLGTRAVPFFAAERGDLILALAVVTATTTVGKFFGLWLAQKRLKRTVAQMRSRWMTGQPPPRSPSTRVADSTTYSAVAGCCGPR